MRRKKNECIQRLQNTRFTEYHQIVDRLLVLSTIRQQCELSFGFGWYTSAGYSSPVLVPECSSFGGGGYFPDCNSAPCMIYYQVCELQGSTNVPKRKRILQRCRQQKAHWLFGGGGKEGQSHRGIVTCACVVYMNCQLYNLTFRGTEAHSVLNRDDREDVRKR